MENYSDPKVWKEFLRKRNLSEKIEPPPEYYTDGLENLNESEKEQLLVNWAWANDEEALVRQVEEDAQEMDQLIESFFS